MAIEHSFTYNGVQVGIRFGLNPLRSFCREKNIELGELEKRQFTFEEALEVVWHAHSYWHTKKGVPALASLDDLVDMLEDAGQLQTVFSLFQESQQANSASQKKKG